MSEYGDNIISISDDEGNDFERSQCQQAFKSSARCVHQQVYITALIRCSSCIGAKQIDGWKAIFHSNWCDDSPNFIYRINHISPSFAMLLYAHLTIESGFSQAIAVEGVLLFDTFSVGAKLRSEFIVV